MDAIILAGGLGTRLRTVMSDRPKPLALIKGTPFLDILLRQLANSSEISRVILATGYKANMISSYFENHDYPFSIHFSQETSPLGTGGALKQAFSLVESETFFVLNGDSYLDLDFTAMRRFHKDQNALITIACRQVEDVSRYGEIALAKGNQISAFREKCNVAKPGLINGGIYLMKHSITFPNKTVFSLEADLFPTLLNNSIFGYACTGKFIDIGTQESYKQAQDILA